MNLWMKLPLFIIFAAVIAAGSLAILLSPTWAQMMCLAFLGYKLLDVLISDSLRRWPRKGEEE